MPALQPAPTESKGHGVNGAFLDRCCELGLFVPPGKRVLLKALWSAHARASNLTEGIALDIRDAIAFEVVAIGPEVPATWGLTVGCVVVNVSISGERMNHEGETSPWFVNHYEDIVGIVDAKTVAEMRAL